MSIRYLGQVAGEWIFERDEDGLCVAVSSADARTLYVARMAAEAIYDAVVPNEGGLLWLDEPVCLSDDDDDEQTADLELN